LNSTTEHPFGLLSELSNSKIKFKNEFKKEINVKKRKGKKKTA